MSNRSNRFSLSLVALATTALLGAQLGGCGGTENLQGEDIHAIRLNPPPVEQTPIMTRADIVPAVSARAVRVSSGSTATTGWP